MTVDEASRIAFLGGGHMARALIGGLLRQGVPAQQLAVGEPQAEARAALEREFGLRAGADNAAAVHAAAVIVLAVKPQTTAEALRSLPAAALAHRPVLLSIAAGVRIADLQRLLPTGVPIVRAMPNRPALLGAGITGLFAPATVTPAQRGLAEQIARAAGRFVWLRAEPELDVVTALSGSGPAYFFLLAECLADGAVELGLERSTALMLAAETLHGSGVLARGDVSLAEQRAAVTSRGGTTQAALEELQAGGFPALVARALRAAAARSAELAEGLSAAATAPSDAGADNVRNP